MRFVGVAVKCSNIPIPCCNIIDEPVKLDLKVKIHKLSNSSHAVRASDQQRLNLSHKTVTSMFSNHFVEY